MKYHCAKCQFSVDTEDTIHFCPNCGEKLILEDQKLGSSPKPVCPVCSTEIEADEATTVCPDCQMVYHEECWKANNGCATYGCKSAGCLNPPPLKVDVSASNTGIPTNPPENSSQNSTGSKCPYCHESVTSGSTICWSCGKDISDISKFVETNGFDFSKLSKLSKALKFVGTFSLVIYSLFINLNVYVRYNMSNADNELINNPICTIVAIVAFVAPFITNIIWLILWKAMKKSIASVVTLAIILFGLLFSGLILGYIFLFATTKQVDTIIKNNGRVKSTFWGVEPIKE